MHWRVSRSRAATQHLSDPSRTAVPSRTEAESLLGIQPGIHLAFNGHSMGQIWHSALFVSVEPYFSWTATDRFPGGNFLIIILEGAKEHRLPQMGCTHGPGSRSLLELYGPRRVSGRCAPGRGGAGRRDWARGDARRGAARRPPPGRRLARESTGSPLTVSSQSAHSQLTVNSQSTHSQLTANSQSTHSQLM